MEIYSDLIMDSALLIVSMNCSGKTLWYPPIAMGEDLAPSLGGRRKFSNDLILRKISMVSAHLSGGSLVHLFGVHLSVIWRFTCLGFTCPENHLSGGSLVRTFVYYDFSC